MDPRIDLAEMVEDLEVNIDELSDILAPLLDTPHHTTASTLPLLDKAKFYVLAAYAIESLLFSTLQASGVDAKEHAVFKELARLKGYFGKIKAVENAGQEPKARLDKEAAARFIKHGLAGNDKYDLERAERIAKEKARAAIKARQMHIKFEEKEKDAATGTATSSAEASSSKKRPAAQDASSSDNSSSSSSSENEATPTTKTTTPSQRKTRRSAASDFMDVDADTSAISPSQTTPAASSSRPPKTKKHKQKKQKTLAKVASKPEESIIPTRGAPRTHTETFNSLLDGSLVEKIKGEREKEKQGKKGKGKSRDKGKGKGKAT